MEKPKALGRWPKAPLAYLIAEIKFQRANNFEDRLPALAAMLADVFPLEETSSETTLSITNGLAQPSSEPLHDFKNFTSTMGVRLTRGSVALHCTDYAGWTGSFQTQWFKVLDTVASVLSPRVLLRSGIRCVDLLVPEGEEAPDSVLVGNLRPWSTGADALGSFEQANIATRFKNGDIATTVLVLSRVQAPMLVSPTLAAMSLALSSVQSKALHFHQSTGRAFAIMDIDVAHEGARPFDLPILKEQYEAIHQLSSAAFRAATTPEAQRDWQAA